MKIIIVGGGKVGFYLAQTLSAQGHEAAIIEQDRELCRMIANQLDISFAPATELPRTSCGKPALNVPMWSAP